MNEFITQLVGKRASDLNPNFKINCFTTVISFFEGQLRDGKTSAQEMLDWLRSQTGQAHNVTPKTVAVVWSSSNPQLSPEKIFISELDKNKEGYPFGLVMEHAFIFLSQDEVFQKASPSDEHRFEIVTVNEALREYQRLNWHRVTLHNVAPPSP